MIPFVILTAIFIIRAARMSHRELNAPATVSPSLLQWQPLEEDVSESLLADVYPSEASAIRALAHHLSDVIVRVDADVENIHLSLPTEIPDTHVVHETLARAFPNAQVYEVEENNSTANKVDVRMLVFQDHPQRGSTRAQGHVQITVTGAHGPQTLSTRYIERPWVSDPTTFVTNRPGHTWIIGRSAKPALSENEARQAAQEDAVRQILPLIQHRTNPGGPMIPVPSLPFVPGTQVLATPVSMIPLVQQLRTQLPVTDRCVQKYQRPYGSVWTESVLVDVSDDWLLSVDHQQARLQERQEVRVKTTVASAMIVLATILIAYLFLNAVTKSYFTGRLRTMAIVFAILVVVVAMGVLSRA